MDVDRLSTELVRENFLTEIVYLEKINSTNDFAKKNKCASDTLILTPRQTSGMGRFNRIWHSNPRENLTFTLTKAIDIPIDEIHLVNFYSSYILFITLQDFFSGKKDLDFSLKWPNDILLNRKKISGFLLEINKIRSDVKNFIIGIGINVNQNDFTHELLTNATSLKKETGIEINCEELLIEFIKNFYSHFVLITQKDVLMKKWISNSNITGKKVNFKILNDDTPKAASVVDIGFDGGLKLKFEDGKIKKYYSGEISLVYG
ncbi:MAG: biotin--[acetyl-CoA-carboxylase] ligase [Bacteroidota bacterium]|nr:biotin--[acetyl-CoA-carboxylase] ligase [Bacteroidota bacterium]